MKILKEAKEELPISFLTAFVSKGWDEVGILKEDIEAIKREFKGTKKVEELIQALIDAYLVCIGQMELHLQNNDYIEFPDGAKDDSLKESLITEEVEPEEAAEVLDVLEDKITVSEGDTEETVVISEKGQEENPDAPKIEVEVSEEEKEILDPEIEKLHETFDYFVDFDEPDLTKAPLTDADLYGAPTLNK